MTYEVDRVGDGMLRVRLGPLEEWPESVSRPMCVYVIEGEHPALINVGHPAQQDALKAGLRAAEVAPESISRVIYNAWSIELLGGASAWEEADHFVFSDDMIQPADYERLVSQQRAEFVSFGRELLSSGPFESYDIDQVESFASSFWPDVPERLDVIPLSNGHRVRAGDCELEVVAAPGPSKGHVALWDAEHEHIFPGHIVHRGMPNRLREVQAYIVSLERLIDLEPEVLWPIRGDRRDKATWSLTGAHRFTNNFMSNAPSAMFESPTLPEFMERDWGYRPDEASEVVWRGMVYRRLLEELERAQMVSTEGEGMGRKYGVDVEDSREELRGG